MANADQKKRTQHEKAR